MNTFNAQGLTFKKLTFGEEEDLFNSKCFDQDIGEFFPKYLDQQSTPDYELNYAGNRPLGVSQKMATPTYNFKNKSPSYFDSLQAENEFELSADSYNFHFENLSMDLSVESNIHPIIINKKTKWILNVEEKDDEEFGNGSSDNSAANKTTMYSQSASPKCSHIIELNMSQDSYYKTNSINQDSSDNKSVSENLPVNDQKTVASEPILKKEKVKNMPKGTLTASDDTDLSQRRDVVNKTVLRIMRRYFMQKFRDMYPQKFKCKDAKSKWYFEYIKRFTAELFGQTHPDLEMLQIYMASIINPKHMTNANIKDTELEKDQFLTFYNTLYKYSHTRLVNLFKVQSLGTLYNHFYYGPMDEIIRSETSVSKNLKLYSAAFADFLRVFEGTTDAHTLTTN